MVKWCEPRAETLEGEENHKKHPMDWLLKINYVSTPHLDFCINPLSCIVIRSAQWHRDGDLIGLVWSSNHFTAASALCRHWAMTSVWLFVLHRHKHEGNDLKSITQVSWSHRQSSWVITQTFLWQSLTWCHLRQVYFIIYVQQGAFLNINISLTN